MHLTLGTSMSREGLDRLFADQPAVMNTEQVSALLNLPRSTVTKWIRDTTIPAYKVGGTWLIPRDELKERLWEGSNQRPDVPPDLPGGAAD